ncbi:MAG: sporulation protein YqfD, partial [Bacilli bacterium]
MKNAFLNFFSGSVEVVVSGQRKETFLNECVRKGVDCWNLRKDGENIRVYIHAKDIRNMRKLRYPHEVKIAFRRRKGLPFLMKRGFRYKGFLLGFVLFFVFIFLLSNMIWGVHIQGATPEVKRDIERELTKMGLNVGQPLYKFHRVEAIQQQLTERVGAITWIGVERQGTHFYFTVVEKEEPKPAKQESVRHLVAKKEAIITEMYVQRGKPLYRVNDYVRKGEVVVSGAIGSEEAPEYVVAKGEVIGETWYETDVRVPRTVVTEVIRNEQQKSYRMVWNEEELLGVGDIAPKKRTSFAAFPEYYNFRFFNYELPLGFVVTQYYPKQEKKIVRSNKELKAIAASLV